MRSRKGGRLPRPEGPNVVIPAGPQASDEDIQASKLFWESLDVDKKHAVMRFSDARLVEKLVEVQQALCSSDLQCYMYGIRGQDAVREKIGMNNFAIMSDNEGQKMEFIAKAPFTERSDLFEYMEAELGTSFLKGRPVLAHEKWHMLFYKAPSSWPEFLRQVLALAEQAVLSAYQNYAEASNVKSKEQLDTMTANSCSTSELTDDQIAFMLQETPAERIVSKSAKQKARKKRQAMLKRSDDETQSTLDESVMESATAASSSTMLNSFLGSSSGTRYPLQSTTPSVGIDDDRVSVSTMDTALLPSRTRAAEDEEFDEELHVDWSAANPIDPAAPLQTVEESVELEVDWNEPEETRWSASMVDAFTGVSAEWHWTMTPRPMLTCGNLRAHIKNTFLEAIYDSNEFPEVLVRPRAKSAPPSASSA